MAKKLSKGKNSWSTRDLLVTIVIGLAFGVLLLPITLTYAGALSAGPIPRIVLGSLYFLPVVFASYVMRKPGAALLAAILSAIPSMPVYSLVILMICGLIGLTGELFTWLFTRHRNFTLARLLMVGAASGVSVCLLILGSALRTSVFEPLFTLAMLLVSAVAFPVWALVAHYLANSVSKTGVLANTALGESNADEI